MTTTAGREELLVTLAAMVLALPDDRPQAVGVTGMSCSGKTTLAAELAVVVDGAGRPVLSVAYDDFHQPRERRHAQGRESAAGYLEDAFDPESLDRLVLRPVVEGVRRVVTASYDLAEDRPVAPDPVDLPEGSIVLVEGSFLLVPAIADRWDLSVMTVAEPERVIERAVVRDSDLGPPERVRELYLRRYLAAEALHQERDDPWSRADVVVDLTDPTAPRLLT